MGDFPIGEIQLLLQSTRIVKITGMLCSFISQKKWFNIGFKIKAEQQYWRHVLERVIAVICTLAERGLAFRGEDETFGSPNNGNYLGLLELLAKFDHFFQIILHSMETKVLGELHICLRQYVMNLFN